MIASKLYFKLFILIVVFNIFILDSYTQDLKLLMNYADTNQFDKLEEAIEKLKGEEKETAAVLYLKALIEKDGDKALAIYNKIIESYSESITAERSLWRVAQYYYIKGLYMKSSDVLRQIIDNFPGTLYARKAKEELDIINEVFSEKEKQTIEPYKEEGKFVVQLGAFGNKQNAQERIKFLNEKGYSNVRINTEVVVGGLLYKVWFGNFDDETSAKRYGELIKQKLRIDYIIVEVNSK